MLNIIKFYATLKQNNKIGDRGYFKFPLKIRRKLYLKNCGNNKGGKDDLRGFPPAELHCQ